MFVDGMLEFFDGIERIQNVFKRKKQPSLLAYNIWWCTNSEWMDRLVAYRQLNLWTFDR
jgi:hypothetical protein